MTREYVQRLRADAREQRRRRIIEAVFEAWEDAGFDGVSLQAVADRAGVSVKTVLRHFGSREELLASCAEVSVAREQGQREVSPGDLPAIVAALSGRYEEIADRSVRASDLEFRHPVIAEWVASVRHSHLQWLAESFAPWLPADGPVRQQRLMALFWATELRCWWALRHALGRSREDTDAVMLELLEALTAGWSKQ